jgi:hypothetical protein
LAMQGVAEGAGFVAGDELPALGDLLLHPGQEGGGSEALRELGTAAVVLEGGACQARCTSRATLRRRG